MSASRTCTSDVAVAHVNAPFCVPVSTIPFPGKSTLDFLGNDFSSTGYHPEGPLTPGEEWPRDLSQAPRLENLRPSHPAPRGECGQGNGHGAQAHFLPADFPRPCCRHSRGSAPIFSSPGLWPPVVPLTDLNSHKIRPSKRPQSLQSYAGGLASHRASKELLPIRC